MRTREAIVARDSSLLSIVTTVCTENRLRFLRSLLDNIVKQVRRDFETIVVVEGLPSLFEVTRRLVSEAAGANVSVAY